MRKIIAITFILLIYNLTYGQADKESFWKPYIESDIQKLNLISFDSLHHEQAYRIWNSYQVVELIKVNDSIYRGQLVNFVTKVTRNEKKEKTISQKLIIPDYTVKKLMEKLSSENIEKLPDSRNVVGYVNGLDGTTYVFEISSNKKKRMYTYWEPESEHYQNPEIPEVKSVRNILKAIKSEIDLGKFFSSFIDNLGIGTYRYGGIIIKKF